MLSEEVLKELTNSIKHLYKADYTEIPFKEIHVCYGTSPYSATKIPTLIIVADGKEYHKNAKIKVGYQCQYCGHFQAIWIKKFLMKTHAFCKHCRETKEKREWHSRVMRAKAKGIDIALHNRGKRNDYSFDNESEVFKNLYYQKHLKCDEFNQIKNHIYSIDGVVVEGNNDIMLLEHEPCANQLRYRQMVKIGDKQIPLQRIKLRCKLCGKIFPIRRLLKEKILNNNFYCSDCRFCNYTFPVQKYETNLTFQGKAELKFIKMCKEKNIPIVNGETVEYHFKGKKHNYRIDFYLPTLKMQVEIKANHIWHRHQIAIGKWEAKEQAAKKILS